MKKILVIITTYNRPDQLLTLLKDIKKKQDGFRIEFIIIQDYSNADYSDSIAFLKDKFRFYTWMKCNVHFGKTNYWELTDKLYKAVKTYKFDYVVQLPDDVRLVDEFFTKAVNAYSGVRDNAMACLNILQDNRTTMPMWTPVNQEDLGNVYKTGWVDMCFIARRNFFESLDYTIYGINRLWSANPNRSSGVGKQISERLYKTMNFYQVKNSLVIHGTHDSVMHPVHRVIVPLVTNEHADKVIAGMASIPERVLSLQQVVTSIINQVDELHVYLNNYKTIPAFLNHLKITAYLGDKESGDLGDVGKFYNVEKAKGYFFTIDDDIIYPPDYVDRMIKKIEQHKRAYPVSLHGRIFDKLPVHSYYKGYTRAFSCLSEVAADTFVHVIGTGVLAFYTDTIKIKLSDFKATNMADIWFSKRCAELNINLLVMAHKNRWIKEITSHDISYSIYNFCNKNEALQTKTVNETSWPPLSH